MTDTTFTNSYIETDAILEAYIGADPRASAIALKALAAANQEWYCQRATSIIDRFVFQGIKLLSTQAREFPRKYTIADDQEYPWGAMNVLVDAYGYAYISTDVPTDVINACCEEAIALYAFYADSDNVDREAMINQGVQNYNLGGVYSETLKSSLYQQTGLRSPEAQALLEPYLENAPFII